MLALIFCCLFLVLTNIYDKYHILHSPNEDTASRQHRDEKQQRSEEKVEYLRFTELESELLLTIKELTGVNVGLQKALQSCGEGKLVNKQGEI